MSSKQSHYLDLHGGSEEANHQKHKLPSLDGNWVRLCAHGNAVCNESTKNLSPAVEAEPKRCSRSLLV
jgi:hypothetical protein